MTLAPERSLLPMAGRTHGRRSPVTCHLKCGDACAAPVPNVSDNETFRDVASSAISRRSLLGGAGALGLVLGGDLLGGETAAHAATSTQGASTQAAGSARGLAFTPIAPVPSTTDAITVPTGYQWNTDHPLGRPDLRRRRRTSTRRTRRPRRRRPVRLQQRLPRHHRDRLLGASRRCSSPTTSTPTRTSCSRGLRRHRARSRSRRAAHGMTVVEVGRGGAASPGPTASAPVNRRITRTPSSSSTARRPARRPAARPSRTRPARACSAP